ncbi:MAG: L-threonylcarbamoyladenylate synthase [bacterium]|nr:L-threonylcarbamoyladenylate synthase [bacterium]
MKKIIEEIEKGNLVIMPTDTVYGIMADATNEDAIKKVFIAKKREKKPLILLVSNIEMLKKYVIEISDLQKELIEKYWPNTLSIIFDKNDNLSDTLTCGNKTVAIRMPNNKLLLEIMNKINKPLISTSANISSKDVITKVDLLEEELKRHISYILDDGEKTNISSTIVKIENNKIIFLREGILADKIKKDFKDYV